ncbi:MATE family efflux transporter [Lentibacillus amyloliquefaciens]|uniref:Multidrug export protein MepA n=1 Tax=Lentibacillus amyloliquefaciens TaxID=1472767 RepID=A0A0U4F9U6_9BACI|nr:MATE family efflux transporter [Lentibacillus amyloliquefaciens]ALX47261.1 MATE family efflux transporter [Lentibacillus amyloliquefaciens]
MSIAEQRLLSQSVTKSFFQYLLPTLVGMMLMSANIVIDGIFVGNGIGPVALASVNVAVPVWSILISISMLIGIGGGTLYSMATGEGNNDRAKQTFTISMAFTTIVMTVIGLIGYIGAEPLSLLFGANDETLSYTVDYLEIIFMWAPIVGWEAALSIFVRNDGSPQLAMTGLIVSAVLNIILNYWMIFILNMEVTGAALASVIATAAGLMVYTIHFLKKDAGLKFIRPKWNKNDMLMIGKLGFPNFLAEAGTGLFVIGYNIALSYYAGTTGLAAFSVINYLHTFMFLAFIGIGTSIQPMISFYYGAKKYEQIKDTVKIAEITGLALGVAFLAIGWLAPGSLVSIFGVETEAIRQLAIKGITIFFIGYLFMGINFIYMTYYQSIAYIKPSIGITLFRGFILLIAALVILPLLFGTTGIWLALPAAEGMTAIFLLLFARRGVMNRQWQEQGY